MLRKLLFVVNPIAGGKNKSSFLELLAAFASKHGWQYHVYETGQAQDEAEIISLINFFSPDAVIAAGGDGTFRFVAQILMCKNIKIGLIPLGSANGMATDLNLPTGAEDALNILLLNRTMTIDAIEVNQVHYGFHISDIGFNARLIERFEQSGKRGMLAYVWQFLKEYRTSEGFEAEIVCDNQKIHTYHTQMVALANASKYGTGATFNPRGDLRDGKFEICVVKDLSISAMIDGILNEENVEQYIDIFSCKSAIIRTSTPILLQVDGEIIGEVKEVNVKIIPQCLPILIGQT